VAHFLLPGDKNKGSTIPISRAYLILHAWPSVLNPVASHTTNCGKAKATPSCPRLEEPKRGVGGVCGIFKNHKPNLWVICLFPNL
jgi:hypothetical protein